MKHKIFAFLFLLIMLNGCAAYRATLEDIRLNPAEYTEQSQSLTNQIDGLVKNNVKMNADAASVLCIGLGYGICFLRKLYQNYKRLKNQSKS
jgi:hypothetical protein